MKGIHYKGIGNTKLTPIDFCGKTWGWMLETERGFLAEPKETEPTIGEHDFNTCDSCQSTHKELIKRLTEKFNGTERNKGFPFCCSQHSNLIKVKEFNRASFVSIPKMVADKIIYTNQHIKNNHKDENYYKDITDYIDYTVESFGQMPNDCGGALFIADYFFYVTDLLKRNTEISEERKNRLLEFLDAHQTPITKNKNTELNILLGTYQKWLKTFPFDISFFSELKPYFEKQLPILNGKPESNKYTGLAKVKMHTKGSLIDVLLSLTKNLLDKVNVPELRKNGTITDIQANQLEFAEAELNTKTAEITKQYSKGELKYVKTLKKWLQLHKDFFKEIAPLLKALPPQQNEKPKPELNEALISFSSAETIENLHNELKGYFQGKEAELKRALQGEQLQEFLLFPHNQNKFVEVFKRLKYNGFLLSKPKETKDWICSTFNYQYQKGNKKEVREFNTSTVHDILTKDKGEPTKKERICNVDWLPYKSHLTRLREAEKESI